MVPAEGGKPRNVASHPATDTFPSFSRDGQWIYFSSVRGGTRLIWKVPVSGGAAVQVSASGAVVAIESSDGAYLYYVESTTTDRPGPLWRLPLKGGEPVKLVEGVVSTSFAVLDGGIYYLERLAGETRLQYLDFATRRSTTVAGKLGNVGFGLTASRDGRAILYSRVDSSVDDLMLVENFR